jgi:hypothetical protein
LPKHASEMARIPKTGIEADLSDAAAGLTEALFRALYSLQHHKPVRCASRALPEEFRKVVRAHADNRSKLRDGQIRRQVVSNVVEHSFETILGHACSISDPEERLLSPFTIRLDPEKDRATTGRPMADCAPRGSTEINAV